jgi:ribonuclease HI
MKSPHFDIYTDGGARPNPGTGAYAFNIIKDGEPFFTGGNSVGYTTNNKMELLACTVALLKIQSISDRYVDFTVTIHTDSKYVKNGITEWIKKWKANSWKTATKSDVKNQAEWKLLDSANNQIRPKWAWVKGHSDVKGNIIADAFCTLLIDHHD